MHRMLRAHPATYSASYSLKHALTRTKGRNIANLFFKTSPNCRLHTFCQTSKQSTALTTPTPGPHTVRRQLHLRKRGETSEAKQQRAITEKGEGASDKICYKTMKASVHYFGANNADRPTDLHRLQQQPGQMKKGC